MNQSDIKALNELKMLSIDMINNAKGGHPGTVLSMAPVMYTLFTRILRVDSKNNNYFNRDRVILSSSGLAPLYYAMCYMAGYPLTKENLMNYRRLNGLPATPELHNPLFMDATTGNAGDGVGVSTGLALGRRYIESLIKEEDNKINLYDFTTYCFLSDADMMSGASLEAFSFAGSQKLGHLVFLYDNNRIGMEGSLDTVFDENLTKSFEAKGFYVDTLKGDVTIKDIEKAILNARSLNKPALLIFNTVIGKDSFNEGKNILHSGVLSFDDANNLRRKYNLFLPPFEVSKDSLIFIESQMTTHMQKIKEKWNESYARAKNINNENLNNILYLLENGTTDISFASENYKINDAYREPLIETNNKVMNLISPKSNLFLGGSAGLSLYCRTNLNGFQYMNENSPKAKNIRFGVRERAMGYIVNGMALLGLRVFSSTLLSYADEMKSSLRQGAIMSLPVTYIFTHDSLYNSEESSLNIPVEQLDMLRAIPNLYVFRPSDIEEVMGSWETILKIKKPCALLITKNDSPKLPNSSAKKVIGGAYIIKSEKTNLDGIIISSGSELISAMQIAYDLEMKGLDIRVVSMPSLELFKLQDKTYKESVLPPHVKTVVIESSLGLSLKEYATNENYLLNIADYPNNGLPIEVLQQMSFDYDSLKLKVEALLSK